MPDPQKKLVQVNGLGVIEFPGGMQDDQIAATIKRHKAQTHSSSPHFTGKSTEESEKARQLKPAQPLDSAIPTLPKWANTPLAPILDKKVDYVDRALWPGGTANWDKLTAESEADKQRFMGKHPIAGGVFEGVNETAEGLTSPANLALMIAAPESKIMSGLFAIQALHGSYKDIEEARKAYREGRNAEASKYATQAVLNLGIAGLAGHHAVKDIPVPEPVKDFARSEEGSVGSQEKVQNPEAENKTVKMLTDGKAGGYRLDHLLKNHPDVTITSVGTESLNPATLKRIQGWTRESKLDDWKNTNANVKDMPPVEVVRTPHGDYLYDGTHRTEFATRQGEKVPATVYTIKTKGDAVTPVAPKIADVKAKAAELQPTTAYKSADQSQPFYLKSENLVSEKMKGPMPAEDVHKMLLSNGVKPEEMKWTGLDELLQGKGKNKVTPQEIKDHLAENNLQIKEVTKESDSGNLKSRLVSQFNSFVYAGQKELGIQADKVAEEIESGVNPETAIKRFVPNPSPELLKSGKYLYDTGREVENARQAGPTKFASYVLPGGENYRELLVTMPDNGTVKIPKIKNYTMYDEHGTAIAQGSGEPSQRTLDNLADHPNWRIERGEQNDPNAVRRDTQNFRSSHWDEPNTLGHIRFNDRKGPNGEKILHIEELQSDWHQKGRTKGYQGELPSTKGWKATKTDDHPLSWTVDDADGSPIRVGGRDLFYGKTAEDAIAEAARTQQTGAGRDLRVPDAPFKKTWPELMLKRMIQYAATHGYDGISWSPGEVQAERYDLSKQVDHIDYRRQGKDRYELAIVDKNGQEVPLPKDDFSAEELADIVGKDVAEKIVAGEGHPGGGRHTLKGLDLKVGGEGMKGFYDKIIPDAANKLGKQWGAKVGEKKASVGTLSRNDIHSYQGPELTQPEISQIYKDIKEGRRNNTSLAEGTNFVNRSYLDQTLMQIASEMGKGRSYEEAVDSVLANNRTLLDNYAKEMGGKVAQKKYQFKKVPYLPITPQMRAGVKSIPYSLFSIPLAAGALTLQQVKAKAEELKPKSVQVRDPHGYVHTFPNQQAADNFKREAGIQ